MNSRGAGGHLEVLKSHRLLWVTARSNPCVWSPNILPPIRSEDPPILNEVFGRSSNFAQGLSAPERQGNVTAIRKFTVRSFAHILREVLRPVCGEGVSFVIVTFRVLKQSKEALGRFFRPEVLHKAKVQVSPELQCKGDGISM